MTSKCSSESYESESESETNKPESEYKTNEPEQLLSLLFNSKLQSFFLSQCAITVSQLTWGLTDEKMYYRFIEHELNFTFDRQHASSKCGFRYDWTSTVGEPEKFDEKFMKR